MSEEKEQVGSVAEEAAKLLGALQDWAKDSGHDSAVAGAASMFRDINEHVATGGEDCRYCPLCRAILFLRQTSPEVKQHLSSAASSLLQAAIVAMPQTSAGAGHGGSQGGKGEQVEKIDLSDGSWDAE